MPKKIPGKLNPPPTQAQFDRLPVKNWCAPVQGIFHRLHSFDRATGEPRPAVSFSQRGSSRFDPANGVGTLCLGESLAGVLLEVFDDRWGHVGDRTRSLTRKQLTEWWVTLVAVPAITAFEAHKTNLTKIGTDMQLLSGDHAVAREWALCLMRHPTTVEGIRYASRHDDSRRNLALFQKPRLLPEQRDDALLPPATTLASWAASDTGKLLCGPPVQLRDHPELDAALRELEVAVLP